MSASAEALRHDDRARLVRRARLLADHCSPDAGFPRGLALLAALALVTTVVVAVFLWRSAGDDDLAFSDLPRPDPGPVHVHGLGVNPADDADELYVALHDGTITRSTDGGATWLVRSTP